MLQFYIERILLLFFFLTIFTIFLLSAYFNITLDFLYQSLDSL